MAITNNEQQQLIALTVGLFDAAPGAQYLEELTAVYEANNNSLEALANFVINTPAFSQQYAGAGSQDAIIGNAVELFGIEADTDAYAEAVTFFENGLANGQSEASLLVEAANYLNSDDVAPEFADIAAKFQNKVEVATYLSVDAEVEEGDIAALKDVLSNVTDDPQSVNDAIAQIDEDSAPRPPVFSPLQDLQEANEARETFLQEDVLASELVQAEIDDFNPEEEYSDTQVADAVASALEEAIGESDPQPVSATSGELTIIISNDDAGRVTGTNIVIDGTPLDTSGINFDAVTDGSQLMLALTGTSNAISSGSYIGPGEELTLGTISGAPITIPDGEAALVADGEAVGDAREPTGGVKASNPTPFGAEAALETARLDVADAVGVLDGLDDTVDYAPENDQVAEGTVDSFDSASRTLQDTFIAESQAVLTEVTEAAEAAVADFTGLSGRIATLQTRKAEFEAALEADFAADAALDNEMAVFNAVNAGAALSGDATSATTIEFDNAALLTRDGDEWSIADDANTEREGIDALLADVQAAYDANQAKDTAEDRFQTAIERVVEAEQGDDFKSFDAASGDEYTIESAEDGDVTLDLSNSGNGKHAPLSQALIDLRESQAALDDALANLDEALQLADTLTERDDDITAAKDVFGEDFDLNLIDLTKGDDEIAADETAEATADDDLFLFNEIDGEEYTIDLFGEQGQDHIFFGNTDYQLVELTGNQTIDNRVGSAEQLEVFWKQNGADLELFVESEAAAGTDQNAESITKVTLTEFSAEDIASFEDGLLSSAPVEVA